MILHPGILSLFIMSIIITSMLIYASSIGIKILLRWDIESSSESQLILERKTYLVSTLMNYVLGLEIIGAIVFIYTVDDIHTIFVGSMCATGSLNANPVGWWALLGKLITAFISAIWISMNILDQKSEGYPLVKYKYSFLLLMLPLFLTETVLQWSYFLGLKPDIITSCCGALFSESGTGLSSSLSSLPIRPVMIGFYGLTSLFIIAGLLFLKWKRHFLRYSFSFLSLGVLFVSPVAIISFISLYFYELPTHHCPFDILQEFYSYVGYPLYITFFAGSFFGLLPGIFSPFSRISSLRGIITTSEDKWIIKAILFTSIFLVIASWKIIFSDFTLEGYF